MVRISLLIFVVRFWVTAVLLPCGQPTMEDGVKGTFTLSNRSLRDAGLACRVSQRIGKLACMQPFQLRFCRRPSGVKASGISVRIVTSDFSPASRFLSSKAEGSEPRVKQLQLNGGGSGSPRRNNRNSTTFPQN